MARLCPDAVRVALLRFCLIPTFLTFLISFTDQSFSLITYDRQTLLGIRNQFSLPYVDTSPDNKPAFPAEILQPTDGTHEENKPKSRARKHRGRRAGIRNRLRSKANRPPLPSILLANVQSLVNKLDDLRARIAFQRDIRDCNVLCFTETWLSPSIPDHSITPAEHFSIARMDRTEESGKSKGGGVCFMTNNRWCEPRNITILSRACTPHQEHLSILCRPHFLPREFTAVIMTAVYIPPNVSTDIAISELQVVINKQQQRHPGAALIVLGDFNRAKLTRGLPEFKQHINFPTRGDNILDHCYTPFRDCYKATSMPAFDKSDHVAVFLVPKYKQKILQEAPVTKDVQRWSDQSETLLQDALENADWEMFRVSSDDINEFAEVVGSYIHFLINDIVQHVKIKVYPNQKPWVDKTVKAALAARTASYNAGLISGDMTGYKEAVYGLRRTVKAAKIRYRDRVEADFHAGDPASVWKGLRVMTDFKTKSSPISSDPSLADELNTFYARFDRDNQMAAGAVRTGVTGTPPFTISESDVRGVFRGVNGRKAAGPDQIPGRVLKSCANQIAPVYTEIFNMSLAHAIVPSCFKQSIIVPVPKNSNPIDLNDYRPVALTSAVMKCFESLVKRYICQILPTSFDPFQFAYKANRSRDDAITGLLHTTLAHLDKGRGNYVRMLFIDYSSAFNTIVPLRLTDKMRTLGFNTQLCNWVLSFLTDRPQVVRVGGGVTSGKLTLNIGSPQGCVLSPLLYNIYTHDCIATNSSNTIIKFADDTVVLGLISNNNEQAYLKEVADLALWCQSNNLALNVRKTKEMVVDFRKVSSNKHTPVTISGEPVERVPSFKYLGVHLTEDLSWSLHAQHLTGKSRQRLYFLRRLRKFKVSPAILRTFYSSAVESTLTGCITAWYGNCTAHDREALQRVVRSAERTIKAPLTSLRDIYTKRVGARAVKIMKDTSHPNSNLFSLLQSGRRLRCINARTERLRLSFYPQAVRLLNTAHFK